MSTEKPEEPKTVYNDKLFDGGYEVFDSLNKSVSLFECLPEMKPTLREALVDIGLPNERIESILKDCKEFTNKARKVPEIAKCGFSDDEAGAIICYTHDLMGVKSMYKIINESLAVHRDRKSLLATRKLMYLLLSGLRKLPPISPTTKKVYRGIRVNVPTTKEEATDDKKVHQFYAEGRTVTFWGFTSTTADLEAVNEFIKGAPESTLFIISGEPLWGYDISAFSLLEKEKEILFEPETKIVVDKVLKQGATGKTLVIEATLQRSDFVLEKIIPVKNAKSGHPPPTPPHSVKRNDKLEGCVWKRCPSKVAEERKYTVDEKNPRIASKFSESFFFDFWDYCTVIGNTPLPRDAVTSWSVKILKSRNNDGCRIKVGVAPSDIDQNKWDNYDSCGWYFDCYYSSLWSGPPHNYSGERYGPKRKESDGKYLHNGGAVGVVMDTAKGELLFAVNDVNFGVAYEGVPLDKPLVPCVILYYKGDSVELVF